MSENLSQHSEDKSAPALTVDLTTVNTRKSLRQVATEIGIDPGYLSRLSGNRQGFPWHNEPDGSKWLAVEEVKTWLDANRGRQRRVRTDQTPQTPPEVKSDPAQAIATAPAPLPAAAAPTAPPAPSPPVATPTPTPTVDANDPLVLILTGGQATALEISRAAMQIAARRVGRSAGDLGFNDLDDLKKSLGELRQAEADYIELEKTKGGLIDRDTVRSIVHALCARLVRTAERMEHAIVNEVEIWLSDKGFAALAPDDRRRNVRTFAHAKFDEIRRQAADSPDDVIDRESKEAQAA